MSVSSIKINVAVVVVVVVIASGVKRTLIKGTMSPPAHARVDEKHFETRYHNFFKYRVHLRKVN